MSPRIRGTETIQVYVDLPPALYDQISGLADDTYRTVEAVIRDALRQYVIEGRDNQDGN